MSVSGPKEAAGFQISLAGATADDTSWASRGGRCSALSPFYEPFSPPHLSYSSSASKPEDSLLCFRRMEADDVSVREQLFHNRVRETIVSDAGLDATVCRLICI